MAEDLVLTPGGMRPRNLVKRVQRGFGVHVAVGGVAHALDMALAKPPKLPQIELKHGAVSALGSGWIAYAAWNNGTGRTITSFETTWDVPPPPATISGQTIFLFSGIQNYGANYGILQPVLQWGGSAAGGGGFWTIASWYVTSGGQAYHTDPIRVEPGARLVGLMALTARNGASFSYSCEFVGIDGTKLPVIGTAELLWCNETLEAYAVKKCTDYPSAERTTFSAISIRTGATSPVLSWTAHNQVADCGQHCDVVDNSASSGRIDVYYR